MRALSSVTAVLVVVVAGCTSGDEPSVLVVGPRAYTQDCSPKVRACDITEPPCQQSIFEATACVRRQAGGELPPVRTITVDEFSDEALAMVSTDGGLEETHWDVVLRQLALVPQAQTTGEAVVDDLVAGVAAFYDPATREVTIIEGPAIEDERTATHVLSHEFDHALQDRAQGLDALTQQWVTSTDSALSLSHIVEGEAVAVSTVVIAYADGQSEANLDWDAYFTRMLEGTLEIIEQAPSPFITALQSLAYPQGGAVAAQLRARGGQPELEAIYRDGPGHASQWIGPAATILDGPFVGDVACFPDVPVGSRAVFGLDSLGAAGLLALLVSHGQPASSALALAAALRSDAIAVFAESGSDPTDAGVAVEWRMEFASQPAAASVQEILEVGERTESGLPPLGVSAEGATIRLWTADSEQTARALDDREGCGEVQALMDALDPSLLAVRSIASTHVLQRLPQRMSRVSLASASERR